MRCNEKSGECFAELAEKKHCCEQFKRTPCHILAYDGCTCLFLKRECYNLSCDFVTGTDFGGFAIATPPGQNAFHCDCCTICRDENPGQSSCECLVDVVRDGGCLAITIHRMDALAKYDDHSRMVIPDELLCYVSRNNDLEECSRTIEGTYVDGGQEFQLQFTGKAYCARFPVTLVISQRAVCDGHIDLNYFLLTRETLLIRGDAMLTASYDRLLNYTGCDAVTLTINARIAWNIPDLGCGSGPIDASGDTCHVVHPSCFGQRNCDDVLNDQIYVIINYDVGKFIGTCQFPFDGSQCLGPAFDGQRYSLSFTAETGGDVCKTHTVKQSLKGKCCALQITKPLDITHYRLSFDDGKPTLTHFIEVDGDLVPITVWTSDETFDGIVPVSLTQISRDREHDELLQTCVCLIPIYTDPAQSDWQCTIEGHEACKCHTEPRCGPFGAFVHDCNGVHSIQLIHDLFPGMTLEFSIEDCTFEVPAPEFYCVAKYGIFKKSLSTDLWIVPPGVCLEEKQPYTYLVILYCVQDEEMPWRFLVYCLKKNDCEISLTGIEIKEYTKLCNGFIFLALGENNCPQCCCTPVSDCNKLPDMLSVFVEFASGPKGGGIVSRTGCKYTGVVDTDGGFPVYFELDFSDCSLKFSCNSASYEYTTVFRIESTYCTPSECDLAAEYSSMIAFGSCFGGADMVSFLFRIPS